MIDGRVFLPNIWIFVILLSACHSHPHDHPPEEETIAVTLWTESFELFMEYPQLRVGQSVSFAAHLTDLQTFEPVVNGPVTFTFTDDGQVVKEVSVKDPLRPGLFIPEVVFEEPATLTLDIVIGSPSPEERIRVSPVQVYGENEEAPPVEEVAVRGDRISYLKEQQWKLPFRTETVSRHTLRESVSLSGSVLARPSGDFRVVPPLAGRYIPPDSGTPVLGQRVRAGQLLGEIEPPLPAPEQAAMTDARTQTGISLAQLEERIAGARAEIVQRSSELSLARKEVERSERLTQIEAVPLRRLDEAQAQLATAEANLQATNENLRTLLEARKRLKTGGEETDAVRHRLPLFAPGAGTLVEASAAAGAFADQQQALFRIVELARVWVRAEVHETDLGAVEEASGSALLRLPDETTMEIGEESDRLLLIGDVVNPETRTLPVIWEVANEDRRLKVGLLLEIGVFTTDQKNVLAVPSTAVLREENRSVVYVHVAGETFDRRIVETGLEDDGLAEIQTGLSSGERVVIEGAYEVGLAARSTGGAGEGHVH